MSTKRIFMGLCVAVLAAVTLLIVPATSVSALSGNEFNPGYIIDDSVYFNGNAMDANQVQQFLNAKVPVCDTWHEARDGNNPPFTCLKDYRQDTPARAAEAGLCNAYGGGNKSAAEIIYLVGQLCGVSQKVLLVVLQKEQSLVTDTWPWANQYRSATGYGCPDTAPCDAQYYGFFNQVYQAARQSKRYVKDAQLFNFRAGVTRAIQYNPNSACGSSNIYIQNPATAVLYNYTPYQPNAAALNNLYGTGDNCSAYGNRNFWRLFSDWFGTTKPAGKWLRQSPDGQVWLVTEGLMPDGTYAQKKFRITSWGIFQAYFLQYEPVVAVSDEYLTQYEDGGTLGTLAIGRSYPHIQFADNGYRYFIDSSSQCDDWGLSCFDSNAVKTIPGTEFLERLTGNGKIRPVVANHGVAYKMQEGKKLPIIDAQSFSAFGYSWSQVAEMQDINMVKPLGPPQIGHQIAVQFNPTSPVVLYSPGTFQFYKVPNYEVFSAWNMQQDAILHPPDSSYTSAPPATTSPDLSIWAWDGGSNKYLIDQGRKINVSASPDMPDVTWQNTALEKLNNLPGAAYGSYTKQTTTGAVYLLESGKKRQVPNWDNFVALGLNINQLLPLSDYSLGQFSNGEYKLGDSTTFEYSGGVWLVNGSNKLHVPSWSYFTYLGLDPAKRITGQSNIGTAYAGSDNLSVLVKDGGGNTFVLQNGTRLAIDAATRAAWGLSPSSFLALSDNNLARIPVVGSLGRFVYGEGYGLYYAEGGQKHHLQSYEAYQARGGNPANTFTVANDFFNAAPTGSALP